jgi:cytochrome b
MDADQAKAELRAVRVWDMPTRLFHWALVVLIPFAWWSEETDHINWHKLSGFLVIALVVFRIYWGFLGSWTARFANFLRGPRAIWSYVKGRGSHIVSHNPLGGWSVAAMILLLLAECICGLFAIDEDGYEAGPFASYLSFDRARLAMHVHNWLFYALLGLIGLHIATVLVYWVSGRNLVWPMISGRKQLPADIEVPARASFWSLAVGLALAAGTFILLWRLDSI